MSDIHNQGIQKKLCDIEHFWFKRSFYPTSTGDIQVIKLYDRCSFNMRTDILKMYLIYVRDTSLYL